MPYFTGIDDSLRSVSICVVDGVARHAWRSVRDTRRELSCCAQLLSSSVRSSGLLVRVQSGLRNGQCAFDLPAVYLNSAVR
jgi:hypothetical protein